ncbi:ABC transporter substrate-binding protein [Auraticoccus sp. F435]|uniref:ABC transporter substrate-binding protein n=1 Tax=Auraticoccus cholistanensis TaxID=2656650 RepID=A0A6A9V0S1_9ACTN|nr:ABC transporter substrate-binding protein [Auraticoccus cholistanensis]MVA75870.1 ABC transporter substrate-binding protein [Auraticoccus cholistanensis]
MTRLDRRTFLAATGAGLATTLLTLPGCRSAVEQASAGPAGGPTHGGRIAAGILTDLVPANFFTNSSLGVTTVVGLAFESLIRYPNDTVEPTPRLATSWELAEDGLALTLELRRGVLFHNGREFTSADVESSIRAYADPRWNGQLRRTAAAITFFDTSEPYRVTLGFEHPLGNVFDLLDTVPVVDAGSLEQLATGEAFVGTGPFKVTSWEPGTAITFDRHEGYWVPERPYADGVDVRVITDATSLLSSLRSGQIQLANGLSYLDLDNLPSDAFEVLTAEGAEQQLYVGTDVTAGSLADVRLRRAIAYAVDRQRVVDEVLRGGGYPINLPWPRYSSAFDEARNERYARDVAAARALVAELGEIETIPYTYPVGNPLVEATAAIVQADLAEVGITVELDPIDQAQFTKRLIGAELEGIWTTFHSWAQYTPSTLTVSAYPFNAAKNASNYRSEEYAEHADAAWRIPDGAGPEAVEAYGEVSEDLLEALFLIELAVVLPRYGISRRLSGVDWTKRNEILLTDAYLGGG